MQVPDSDRSECMGCHNPFSIFRRRHHCRVCGEIFCGDCCNFYVMDYRVCGPCQQKVLRVQKASQLKQKDEFPAATGSRESTSYLISNLTDYGNKESNFHSPPRNSYGSTVSADSSNDIQSQHRDPDGPHRNSSHSSPSNQQANQPTQLPSTSASTLGLIEGFVSKYIWKMEVKPIAASHEENITRNYDSAPQSFSEQQPDDRNDNNMQPSKTFTWQTSVSSLLVFCLSFDNLLYYHC